VLGADGGWYAVIQVPSMATEEELVIALVERDGVLVHPGFFFDFPRESFVVVSLLPPPDTFAAGTTRLFRHFDCSEPLA
jgi:aspartate/methionine/tyrosine aminotransferase